MDTRPGAASGVQARAWCASHAGHRESAMTKIPVPGLKVLSVAVLGLCAGIMPPPGHAAPGDTQLVTATLAGLPSGQSYDRLSVSADGRYVAFQSSDPTLVPDDTNGVIDVFVRDVLTGTTERMSVGAGGEQANHE